ncbi:hypothetical protein BZA77DRAFT_357092 [Pyronema omphalodes]|nr:hypothetical protein BZA77DRAFT_357092 [Pyronema omphalodes]
MSSSIVNNISMMQNNMHTTHANVVVNDATIDIGNSPLPNVTATESSSLKTISDSSAPVESSISSATASTTDLVEGIYITPQKIKVEISFKVHHSVIGERDLPPGKVQLRIGNARVMIVDAKDVAGMGLTMVKEGVKKRLTTWEKWEKREMRREESRARPVGARKVLLDERRRRIEGIENDTQKMVREWKEKRRRIKLNGKGGVDEGCFGGAFATTGMMIA